MRYTNYYSNHKKYIALGEFRQFDLYALEQKDGFVDLGARYSSEDNEYLSGMLCSPNSLKEDSPINEARRRYVVLKHQPDFGLDRSPLDYALAYIQIKDKEQAKKDRLAESILHDTRFSLKYLLALAIKGMEVPEEVVEELSGDLAKVESIDTSEIKEELLRFFDRRTFDEEVED